ncbi:MAG: CRISPR-associated endonuclease Cas2 [Saprospiraceae bacterium]|nr:CRISPR-associated endonuclease Cas2 [Saprospiraceae bacterium]
MKLRLICYDITNDKKRLRVSKLLLKYGGCRMQRSVFSSLQREEDFHEMRRQIEKIMQKSEEKTDSIYYIPIGQEKFETMHITGFRPDFDHLLDKKLFIWI